ncbi:immunity 22 family protein [Pseudobacillus badius]|uniref:immunity 22 family protein n=1 Tax=Bacillus badius TaxID=1455 RepID=UPI0007B09415|nr:immunity 22 family protein [Bacillus badius]KZN99115.1 hypothetical protein A4244_08475 [Bacillus badius]OCS84053.1 hypothetical protein A6M11_08490 [Bacillus badius]OVE52653.1 hypothetical protein B1A98_03340 [Bacillus badius]TDW04661.1 immunity protein 22 of polymorphic toxin system [Bacillus badius]
MERDGYVSLWTGTFKTNADLQQYLLISYNEDGDAVPSEFEEDVQLAYYDEDFMEAEFFEETINHLAALLEGCSYDDAVIPGFTELQGETLNDGVNSFILLYDFQYREKQPNALNRVQYIGSIRYK